MSKYYFLGKGKNLIMIDRDEMMKKNFELNKDIIEAIIKEAFQSFDEDRSGEIDSREFKKLIKSLGYNWNNEKISEIMMKMDKNKSGFIEIDEFTNIMLTNQRFEDFPVKIHLENTFTLYDKDQDGIISIEDLIIVSKELEDILESQDASLIISFTKILSKELNREDKINGITKEEFILLLYNLGFIEEKNPNKTENMQSNLRNNLIFDISKNTKNNSIGSELELEIDEK